MNRGSIRVRFFGWMSVYTLIIFGLIGVILLLFNLHEQYEHPEQQAEEAEELLVMVGIMLLILPITLGIAWQFTRRLLRPWRALTEQAEYISHGHLEERIENLNKNDEIGRLAQTLNHTFDRYSKLLEQMDRFCYDASHQLRNPLAAIQTNGSICLAQPRSERTYIETIEGMLDDAERLSQTVSQLLMLARVSGDLPHREIEKVDLKQVIEQVAHDGRIVGELRSITMETTYPEQPISIPGNHELLAQALTNLIDNALRFSPERGVIHIMAEIIDEDVRVCVIDQGPGIEANRRATLFRPRNQSDIGESPDRQVGLGLLIFADICRAHNASFGVDQPTAGGSCFWLKLKKV